MGSSPAAAFIGLGGNLGDRHATLNAALRALDASPGIHVTRCSSLHEYPAWGPIDQPAYINAVAAVETSLSPQALLATQLTIERTLGRDRANEQRWGPRTLDLDLLLYDRLILNEPGLRVPHPWITTRRFVLEPLHELAPGLVLPGTTRTVAQLLQLLDA